MTDANILSGKKKKQRWRRFILARIQTLSVSNFLQRVDTRCIKWLTFQENEHANDEPQFRLHLVSTIKSRDGWQSNEQKCKLLPLNCTAHCQLNQNVNESKRKRKNKHDGRMAGRNQVKRPFTATGGQLVSAAGCWPVQHNRRRWLRPADTTLNSAPIRQDNSFSCDLYVTNFVGIILRVK